MPDGRGRAGAGEYAQRVNAAAELVEAGVPVAEAAHLLAERFGWVSCVGEQQDQAGLVDALSLSWSASIEV